MLKFWQVIATILIFYLAQFLLTRGITDPAEFILVLVIWALVSAFIWVSCYFAFRAIDPAISADESIRNNRVEVETGSGKDDA